jgi:cation diffusion facilitator CzcD-associated flavoprotein CzcO
MSAPRLRVAVIGAGMAGILAAIKLDEAGFDDVVVFEKADRLGGTWRENTYPGIACDVPSHLYSYSFAPNPDWSRTFSPGEEIQGYFERVARERGVLPRIEFGHEVVGCEWIEPEGGDGRWLVTTRADTQEREHVVDVVIAATGVLHHPRMPDFEGMESFAGAAFHSSRWDHDVPLDGKRIGVVGTGSTAVQITSALAARAGHYTLFQRTAQWIMPQLNPPYTEEEKAAWRAAPERLVEIHDRLSEVFGGFARAVIDAQSAEIRWIEDQCLANLEENVRDPELRERLRPDYRAACKRLVISPDFYAAIQQPTAELVTDAIERIEPEGVRTADGRLHELDVLVLATGFRADAFMRPMGIVGANGLDLGRAWHERPNAYLSITMPGFPNFFMINGPNGPVGNFSLIEVAELQMGYLLQLVEMLRSDGVAAISPTTRAMEELEAARVEAARDTVWVTGCRSWYLDDRGIPATWPWSFDRFREVMRAPDLDAFEIVARQPVG